MSPIVVHERFGGLSNASNQHFQVARKVNHRVVFATMLVEFHADYRSGVRAEGGSAVRIILSRCLEKSDICDRDRIIDGIATSLELYGQRTDQRPVTCEEVVSLFRVSGRKTRFLTSSIAVRRGIN